MIISYKPLKSLRIIYLSIFISSMDLVWVGYTRTVMCKNRYTITSIATFHYILSMCHRCTRPLLSHTGKACGVFDVAKLPWFPESVVEGITMPSKTVTLRIQWHTSLHLGITWIFNIPQKPMDMYIFLLIMNILYFSSYTQLTNYLPLYSLCYPIWTIYSSY